MERPWNQNKRIGSNVFSVKDKDIIKLVLYCILVFKLERFLMIMT